MLKTKNISPKQLAFFTALALAVPLAIGVGIIRPVWWVMLLSFIIIFLGSYALFLYTLQNFIYRKIKLIYKLIYQTKATKREEFYHTHILPQKSIDEVREDVEAWAKQKKFEIETLRQNESFRKEFLQNLSHELKTPVFTIQGYIDTLLDGALHNDEVNTKFLQKTAQNLQRLVSLLDDLDQISQLETGALKLNTGHFIIQQLYKEAAEELQIKAQEKQISCVVKKGCEDGITVNADKEKIRQVFINIIANALKYGRINGLVEAGFYILDDQTVLVEISDDGYGIAEEHLPRIFERFYRADLARSRSKGGSGLGLAICKHIIEAHGQNIHVRSKKEVGTTIGFTLEKK